MVCLNAVNVVGTLDRSGTSTRRPPPRHWDTFHAARSRCGFPGRQNGRAPVGACTEPRLLSSRGSVVTTVGPVWPTRCPPAPRPRHGPMVFLDAEPGNGEGRGLVSPSPAHPGSRSREGGKQRQTRQPLGRQTEVGTERQENRETKWKRERPQGPTNMRTGKDTEERPRTEAERESRRNRSRGGRKNPGWSQ